MATRNYRKYDEDFKQGAVALVVEAGKPIAQVARELGVNEGTLGNWCAKARRDAGEGNGELSETEPAELARLRKEHTELRMQRDVLKRSVALGWTRRWAGRRGRLRRFPEGAARGPACDRMSGAVGVPGVALQMATR